jgi:Tfp pilus assembly protein FimT
MIVPQMVQSAGLQANSTARMLMADLEYAQSQAIATQLDTTVTFSTADNKYWVSNTSGTLIHPITKKNYEVLLSASGPTSAVTITAANFNNQPTVTFSSLGAPSYSGTVTLAAGAFTYKVAVAPITGRVTVVAQ